MDNKECPVCGGYLFLDDTGTELHCDTCDYTANAWAFKMCEYMCPAPEEDTMEE